MGHGWFALLGVSYLMTVFIYNQLPMSSNVCEVLTYPLYSIKSEKEIRQTYQPFLKKYNSKKLKLQQFNNKAHHQQKKQKMGCTGSNTNKSSSKQQKFSRYSAYELQVLQLMFQDIASRAAKPGIIRQHFDSFFHLNGLWGDEMFRLFDKGQEGFINFEAFLTSIDIMVKGTFQQKSKVLFNFYDADKSNGISFNQLVKMLFSYPKSQLNRMVTEQNFLNSIDDYQKNFYFHPEKLTFREMNVVEEDSENQEEKEEIRRMTSVQGAAIRTNVDDGVVDKEARRNQLLKLKQGQRIQEQGVKAKKNGVREQQPFKSILTQTKIEHKRKKYVVRSNIASLVRKYAAYLFKQFRLDTRKQQMGFDHFLQLIKNHQSIFNSYFQGFHCYIWQFDQSTQQPQFRKNSPWIEGFCQFVEKQERSTKYLYFMKTTLFVLSNQKSSKPLEVINMEGLTVEEVSEKGESGFVIKHRDGVYPEKKCLFQSPEVKDEWMTHMQEYKSMSVYDCYTFSEKVGEGNFSSVYKGVSKEQKQKNEEVAIKVIKKFELSLNQKNVLKSECNILELCHHPNILKLHHIFNTRTHLYIVTEFLGEGDLFEYVKSNSFLEEYEAALIMKQLVEVLKYFDEVGLIHRDLKPENVMIIMNKEKSIVQKVKIIDFGFGVYKNALKGMDPKEKYAGTPGFIPPEIVNCEDFDESVDIFSLGVILYFMLCGSLPFFSSFLEEIIEQTRQCNIVLKNAHWNNVSEQAKDLVYKMITFKHERIQLKQLIEHPWLQNIEQLKKYNKVNKKNRYI